MRKTKNNVPMAIVGTVLFLFLGILYAWSIFRVELEKLFPFSAAQMSLTFSIAVTFFCLGGLAGGRLILKKSAAFVLRVSSVLVLIGFCGVSLMSAVSASAALVVMYVCYGVLAGFGVGMAYNVGLGNVAPWFPGHIGLVSGIMLMGFGFSGMVFSLVLDVLCPIVGIFGIFIIFGVCMAIALIAASFFIRRPEAAAGGNADRPDDGRSLSPKQMVKSASFWVYFLWNVLNIAAGLLVINSSANIAIFYGGTASLGMIISVFNGLGRPATGAMSDRVSRFAGMGVMSGAIILSAACLISTSLGGSKALMVLGLIIMGTAYGGGSTLTAKVINATYGPRYYPANHSVMNTSAVLASFVGPYISGLLLDSAGGEYKPTFVMLLAIGIVEVVLIFVLKFVLKREEAKKS